MANKDVRAKKIIKRGVNSKCLFRPYQTRFSQAIENFYKLYLNML